MKAIEQVISTRTGKNGVFHAPSSVLRLLSSVFCLLSSVLCPLSRGQEPVDALETWEGTGLAGWTHDSPQAALSCVTNNDTYLNLCFARQPMADLVEDVVRKNTSGVVITNLSFRFRAATVSPSALQLCLHSAVSGNEWYVNLPVPRSGEWVTFDVPVSLSTRWFTLTADGSEDTLQRDLQSMDSVGVYIRRHGASEAQDYGIDDFRIQGRTIAADLDSNADGIPDVWDLEHGLSPYAPDVAALDSDQDGTSNYAEYRAGTDPNNAASLFELGVETTNAESVAGVILRWDSVANRVYSVWRATDLLDGFREVGAHIPATPPVNEFEDSSATNAGPYFYRLQVEP